MFKYAGFTQINVSQINYGDILKDKTILITGGSQGIGLAISKASLAGGKVIITGRSQQKLDKIVADINHPNLIGYEWDVTNTELISKHLNNLECENIDILINNAGVYSKTHFPHCTSEDWDAVYATNAKATFFICQEICKKWMSTNVQKTRKIINISSQGGFSLANNPYRMTKWDIRGFTKYLGNTMSRHGIIVNCIAPGIVLTDMQPELKKQGKNAFITQNPLQRYGLPEEIAELAIFLASDVANFIVGQTICCDGGYSVKQ